MARELHDTVLQQVVGVRLLLRSAADGPDERVRDVLGEAEQGLDALLVELRAALLALSPPPLERGLVAALAELAAGLSRVGVPVRLVADAAALEALSTLDRDVELELTRFGGHLEAA